MLETVRGGGWDWNITTGDVFFSDSWLNSLGYQRDEVEPNINFWKSIVHLDDRMRVMEALEAHCEGRNFDYKCEKRVRIKSGEYRWSLDVGKVVARDAQGKALRMVSIEMDITERKRAEEKLRQSEKMRAIGQLSGGIAHDFNNMLGGIMGAAELLMLEESNLEKKNMELIDVIINASTQAADLTAKLLAFGRKGNMTSMLINFHQTINDTVNILQRTIDKKIRISVKKDAQNDTLNGDNSQLQNALDEYSH